MLNMVRIKILPCLSVSPFSKRNSEWLQGKRYANPPVKLSAPILKDESGLLLYRLSAFENVTKVNVLCHVLPDMSRPNLSRLLPP